MVELVFSRILPQEGEELMRIKYWLLTELACIMWISATLSVVMGFDGELSRTVQPRGLEHKAKQILDTTNIKGGLIIHIGCDDGKLTAALQVGESYLVHGLDSDADKVRQARQYIQSLGIYGSVAVEQFDGKRLPYVDNLVNLVVAEDLGNVTPDELTRVLCPKGVAYIKRDNRWIKMVKPRPDEIDEWTHYFHDASGNAVAHDKVVGPPCHLQWIAEPRHTRSHEHIPGIYALVSAGGRIFYIADEASIASIRQTPKWQLVARDAFNGILLWKRSIKMWFPHIVNWGQTPRQLQRKLVAVGDRVYVTIGLHAPLSALDAATGETLKLYEETRGTEEIVCHKGILLLVVRNVTEERVAELAKWAQLIEKKESPLHTRESAEPLVKRLRATEAKGAKAVLALDADTGRLLWKKDGADVTGLRTYSLCAYRDRVFYQNGKDIVCLDLRAGRQLWSVASTALRVVAGDSVFCADGKKVTALSTETGRTQWTQATLLSDIRDVFVANGSLWLGGFKPFPNKRGPAWGPYFVTQRDLATGKMLMQIEPENPGHHHRCYLNKATDRYILAGRRGTEFIDLASGDVLWHSWARGVCKYGIMPCNGLLYVPPHACGCYIAAKLTGFNALAPKRQKPALSEAEGTEDRRQKTEERLQRGPAYDKIRVTSDERRATNDWPTYRNNPGRSGFTGTSVPSDLKRSWQQKLGGRLSSVVIADGKVFVSSVDTHTVHALNADSGKKLWSYTAGGRVDSPPTIYQSRVLFGCRDGYVYSLRASDGVLAWRLRAAREQELITACGQLESASPIHGSVLVQDGVAYFTAGRSSYLDGGIDLYRLDPETGKTLSRTQIYSPDPETGKQPKHFAPSAMPGARADILTSDGSHIYSRDMVFDKRGIELPEGRPHLFTLTDFLDDSWPHRSYWIFGTHCSISTGCSGRDKNLIYGRLLVFDGSKIYGYGRNNIHWSNQLQDGAYRLFSVKRGEITPQWDKPVTIQVRAMVLADKVLFVAGPFADAAPNRAGGGPERPARRTSLWVGGRDENQAGPPQSGNPALLMAISASNGTKLAQYRLDSLPVFDGMIAANDKLFLALKDGSVVCFEGQE